MSKAEIQAFEHSFDPTLKVGTEGSRIESDGGPISVRQFFARIRLFIRSLVLLACQRKNWLPTLIAKELWGLLTNIRLQREILKLFNLRPFADIAQNNPRLAFKYLKPHYLVRSFTVPERACCLLHHYKRIHEMLPEKVLCHSLNGDVVLHEIADGVNRFAVTMSSACALFDNDIEGELILDLQVNGEKVSNLSFTIIPGWVVKLEVEEVLLITRVQGLKGCFSQIRLATKALHDVAPSALLLAALQGIGDAFGIQELVAVSCTNQSCYLKEYAAFFRQAYDDFFVEVGMAKTSAGLFRSPIPIEDKPIGSVKQGHKLRTKEKRAFKQEIKSACTGFFLALRD